MKTELSNYLNNETEKLKIEMKNETTHTPGPWKIHPISGRIVGYEKVVGRFLPAVATVLVNKNEEANANLIAAAPALLEACKLALSEGDEFKAIKALKSAIALAEGKQS